MNISRPVDYGLIAIVVIIIILASAAFLDAAPMLDVPVKRPAPLRSPKHASLPKDKPMARVASASYSLPPVSYDYAWNLNFFGCDTNNPGCVLYDMNHVKTVQPAHQPVELQFSDDPAAIGWAFLAAFDAPPEDRDIEVTWYLSSPQRPAHRFYRSMLSVVAEITAAGTNPSMRINHALPGFIMPKSTPRKK